MFSKKYFNGGGHKNASGGVLMNQNMDESIAYFSRVLDDFLNEK